MGGTTASGRAFRHRWSRISAVCLAIVLVGAACGDDDDDGSTTDESAAETSDEMTEETSEETTEETTEDESDDISAEAAAFCTSGPMVDEALAPEEPDPETVEAALTQAEADAPEALADSVTLAATTIREILETGNFDLFEGEEFQAALADIDGFYVSDCGFADLGLVAVEYSYDGIPEGADAGQTVMSLTNDGTEVHEAFVARINDDVDLTAEELLALPEDEAETMVTETAFLFAPPGASDSSALDLEPGRYLVACFIPVGTTPDNLPEVEAAFEAGEELAPPHFTEGMFAEFEVS